MAVAMGTTGAPATQSMLDNCPGLLAQQKFDIQELFCPACQKRNKYKITSDEGWSSDGVTDFSTSPYKQSPQIYKAKEESETCDRICCQNYRRFQMYVRPGDNGDGPYDYKFDRPFKCTLNCCGLCLLNPQELTVMNSSDTPIGKVVQEWRCFDSGCCLKIYWQVQDANGGVQYYLRDDLCCPRTFNICAPSCLCGQHHIDILDASEQPTDGYLRNIFPGCNMKGLLGGGLRDSYHLKFPSGATAEQKATLLGGMFLVEYMLFESNGNEDGLA
jgi:hypothetical protein